MKYSEIKKRILILRKHGFVRPKGMDFFSKTYCLNHWRINQAINIYDITHFKYVDGRLNLNDYLCYLYEKNMRLLFEYDLGDFMKKFG